MVFNCKLCDYQTDFKFNFQKHLKTKKHLVNQENCEQNVENVEKSMKSSSDNNQKVLLLPPHKLCEWCRRSFARKDSLYRHYKVCKYKNNSLIVTSVQKGPEGSKNVEKSMTNFVCQYCNNIYSNTRSLNKHIKFCFTRFNEIEKIKNNKENEKLQLIIDKEKAINIEKDKTIEIAKQTNIVNITNNTSNKTINYLNTHFGDMIAMEQFLHNLEHNEKLTLTERENLLLSYTENGIDVFARNFSFIMKQNCKRQLASRGISDLKLLPLFCSDGNLRSHKEKQLGGWKTYYDNNSINKMLNISNNQIHESYQQIVPISGKERTRIYKEIKKDNHQTKFLSLENKSD